MDHEAVQERFSDYLESELPPEEQAEVATHLEGCEACRNELLAFRQTLRTLSGLRPIPAPEGFVGKVQQRINKRSRGRFFRGERLFMRAPFEWISFVIIILMLALYILMMQEVRPSKDAGSKGKGPTPKQLPIKKSPRS
jgi:predicted anti-sigma-YlaC factor YlaD